MFFEDSKEIFTDSDYKKLYGEITERLKYLWKFFCNIRSALMENSLPNFSKVALYCTVLSYVIACNTSAY